MTGTSPNSYPLKCRCGTVSAEIATRGTLNIACYCADCRAFARLKGEEQSLVPGGGVEMLQATIDQINILSGSPQLGCMQFKKGAPVRWFAKCCDAPLWLSMPRPGVPHLSVPATLAKQGAGFGPVRGRVNVGSATGPIEDDKTIGLFGVIIRMVWRLLRARLRGAQKASPLYDPQTGWAIAKPTLASDAQISKAYRE